MADNETSVILNLDNSEFLKKMQESIGLKNEFFSVENVEELIEKLGEIGIVVGVVAAAFLAMKTAVDWVEEAEKIQQINAAFDAMSTSAGLASSEIKEKLIESVHGLASEGETLQAATRAMSLLGKNAKDMPAIMELARKETALFGGELLANFESLSSAMARGNVRALAAMGITVDHTKALKAFADNLGIGVKYLTEAEKKQALFNASMEAATKTFAGVDPEITKVQNSFSRITAALKDIKEIAVTAWDALAGTKVGKMIEGFADSIKQLKLNLKDSFSPAETKAGDHKKALEANVEYIKKLKEENKDVWGPSELARYNELLEKQEAELRGIYDEERRRDQLLSKRPAEKAAEAPAPPPRPLTDQQKADKAKFEQELLTLTKERLKAEESVETDANKLKEMHDAEEVREAEVFNQKLLDLDRKYAKGGTDAGIVSAQKLAEMKEELARRTAANIEKINQKYRNDEVTALKNLADKNRETVQGFATGWKLSGAEAEKNVKDFAGLGQKSLQAFSTHAASAFKAIGDGSKNAADALKGFMFGAIGQIAEAQGQTMILAGLGTGNFAEAAEGAALVALGGAISALGSSSGSSLPAGGSAGGGGGAAPGLAGPSLAPTPTAAPQSKSVTIAISGNYFETDQTRTRLMEMIREAGDFTDFKLRDVGQV